MDNLDAASDGRGDFAEMDMVRDHNSGDHFGSTREHRRESVKEAATRRTRFFRKHQGPRAILNAVERLANTYRTDCARVRQDLRISEAQLRDHQARLGQPFPHDAYLSELTVLRDQLKASLSATAQANGEESKDGFRRFSVTTGRIAIIQSQRPRYRRQRHAFRDASRTRHESRTVPPSPR